ncbi:MAG TPA: hypothetical protein VGJ59_20295 [Jatrophihabitantaceae bacterium]
MPTATDESGSNDGDATQRHLRRNTNRATQASFSTRQFLVQRPYLIAYLAVAAAVVLANATYLLGFAHLDPYIMRSGLSPTVEHGVLPGYYTIDPSDGFISQALGAQALHQVLSGHIPWWNPYEGLGAPLLGEMESAALFPLVILQALPDGFLIFHIALELVAGCATVALVRSLGLHAAAAGLAGVLFGLNGALVWLLNAPTGPVAFVPLVLVGIERARRSAAARAPGGYLTVAVAVWLSIVAGFPEGAYLGALLALVWAIWRLAGSRGYRRGFAIRLAAGSVLGLSLAAPSLWSFTSYVRDGGDVGTHAGSYADVSLTHPALGSFFAPYAYGLPVSFVRAEPQRRLLHVWENIGGYVTIACLLMALVGATGRRHRGARLLCAAWATVGLGRVFGLPVITQLVDLIPGMIHVWTARYFNPTVVLCVAVLVAFTIDDILRHELRPARVVGPAIVSSAVVIVGWRLAHPAVAAVEGSGRADIARYFRYSYLWAVVSLLTLTGAALLSHRWSRPAAAMVCGVLAVEAIVAFEMPSLAAPRSSTKDTALIAFLSERASLAKSGQDLGRVFSATNALAANYGSYYDVAQLNVNDRPVPSLWTDYVESRLDPVAGLRFIGGSRPAARQALAQYVDGYRAAAVEWVLLPLHAPVPAGLGGALQHYEDTAESSIYRLGGALPYASAESAGCTVTAKSRTAFDVDCPTASTLVRRELYFTGWHASVNGHGARIRPYDTTFQSVSVPAGHSTVRFSYTPPDGNGSVVLALIAFLVLAGSATVRVPTVRRALAVRTTRRDTQYVGTGPG